MKNILKGSILLIIFSFSIALVNISCNKEASAQTNTNTTTTQPLGILVFAKGGDKSTEFWTAKYDGTNQTKISLSGLPSTAELVKGTIRISPDGKKFFFTLNLNPVNSQDAIYSCNVDGSGLTKLIDNVDEFSDVK